MNITQKKKIVNEYESLSKRNFQSKEIMYKLQAKHNIKSRQTIYNYVKQYKPELIKSYNLPFKTIK